MKLEINLETLLQQAAEQGEDIVAIANEVVRQRKIIAKLRKAGSNSQRLADKIADMHKKAAG